MGVTRRRWHDELRELAAQRLRPLVAEDALGCWIELEHSAMAVDDDHRIECRVQDRGRIGRSSRFPRHRLRARALSTSHRLATIVADRGMTDPRTGYGRAANARSARGSRRVRLGKYAGGLAAHTGKSLHVVGAVLDLLARIELAGLARDVQDVVEDDGDPSSA